MNQRTFLYQLQLIDLELDKNEKRLSEIQKILSFSDDVKNIENEITSIEAEKRTHSQKLKKVSDEAELIQDKIKKSEQSLYDGSIKNPKELQSVNSEIASLKNRLSSLDEQQLEIMFLVEDLDNQISIQKSALENLMDKKKEENKDLQSEFEGLVKTNLRLKTEKKPIQNQIDDEYQALYEKLRKSKNNIAVSLIVDNACSICGNGLPPMEVQKAKSSVDEVFCSVCKRFLYCG